MKKLLVFLITGLFLVGCSHNSGAYKCNEPTVCSVVSSGNTAECRYQYFYYNKDGSYFITHRFDISVKGPELPHYKVTVPSGFETNCENHYVTGEYNSSYSLYSYETVDDLELFEATNTKALLVPVYALEVTYARK